MPGELVNDVHSQLNRTRVASVQRPASPEEVQALVRRARALGAPIAVSGSRHAMGGQQFRTDSMLLDLRGLNRLVEFDPQAGLVTVEAGIEWADLVPRLIALQEGLQGQWGIAQKQTGADRLTVGGALAVNAHGRGLRMAPIVADIEAFTLVGANGELVHCSRREHRDLFSLAIGGYGLFGVVTAVTLRLAPRCKLRRVVAVLDADDLPSAFERRIEDGFLYGDFQFSIDERAQSFMCRGIFSCYEPADRAGPIPAEQRALSPSDWLELIRLAHHDRAAAQELYEQHYLATSGQAYWSDESQLGFYLEGYHETLGRESGSELITELYVPREQLPELLQRAAEVLLRRGIPLIYGTVRLIERDDETVLSWARQRWACVILNLHVDHTRDGIAAARHAFPRIDRCRRRPRWQLLPDLPPLRDARAGARVPPADAGIPAPQTGT